MPDGRSQILIEQSKVFLGVSGYQTENGLFVFQMKRVSEVWVIFLGDDLGYTGRGVREAGQMERRNQ